MINLDDGLDLLTNLLTLFAIGLVALEKARPDQDGRRKNSLRLFVNASVFTSPDRIRRRVALMMARSLKGSSQVGKVLGILAAPGTHLLKGRSRLQSFAVLSLTIAMIIFAIAGGSPWPTLILPGILVTMLAVAWMFPVFYLFSIAATFYENLNAGRTVTRRVRTYVLVDIKNPIIRYWLTAASFVHPDIIRREGQIGFGYFLTGLSVSLPLLVVMFGLAPIAITIIDGFFLSPWQMQLATGAIGFAIVVFPALVVVLIPLLSFQQQFFSSMSIKQSSWAPSHLLRATAPVGAISVIASLSYALISDAFASAGGGWFVFTNLAIDIWLAGATGLLVRDVIRRRANARSTIKAMTWVLFLVLIAAGAKLCFAMIYAPAPLGLVDAYRTAFGIELLQNGSTGRIGLFLVSQTASLYWLFYGITLLIMLSLSAVARVIASAFGLALNTVSPLEILATYLTFVAGLAALAKSVVKMVW